MLNITLNGIIDCTQIPSFIAQITPKKIKEFCGHEYTAGFREYDYGGGRPIVKKESVDYKLIIFDIYDGIVEDVVFMFSVENPDTINKVKMSDYYLFCHYTLKDIVTLLSDKGIEFQILDSFAFNEYICLQTLNLYSGVSFDFNWLNGKWMLVSCYIPLANLR